jgi:ribosome biogenesis GTPase
VPVQVLAANVDVVLVATSLNRDLNQRRLERYLATAHESGARPLVVLTKADLARDPVEVAIAEVAVAEVAASVDVLAVSALTGTGLDRLAAIAREGTVVLVGSSGVGKSTLINALLGRQVMATREIREDDSHGRHMTTRRQLVALPGGGALIDTPGLRELGLWGDEGGLASAFADVEGLAERCRFADCAHEREPGCAVVAAVASGELAAERFSGWQKLRREERHAALEQDAIARRGERRRWAVLGRAGAVRAAVKRGEWPS